jgi:hypothetical protein
MTIQSIIDLVNFIADKEQQGLTLTPDNFNVLLPSVQWDKYNFEIGNLVKDELTPIAGELASMSPLNPFKISVDLNPVGGIAVAPDDYVRFLSFTTFGYNDPIAQITVAKGYRDVTPVSSKQFSQSQNNVYARLDLHPVLKITSALGKFIFSLLPNDVPVLQLDYLRTPATPYYDYCQDAVTGNPIYMPVKSYIHPTFATTPGPGGGTTIVSVDLVVSSTDYTIIYPNVIKEGWVPGYAFTTQQPYTSKTVELEWEQKEFNDFVLRLLLRVGLNLSTPEITKYADEKLKENA